MEKETNETLLTRITRLLSVFRTRLTESLHVASPGVILTFDATTQTASIRLMTRRKNKKGETMPAPILYDVPVFFPGGSCGALTWPVAAGDECLVIFADGCIDGWMESGSDVLPPFPRHHDLSDGFAFVGFRSHPKRITSFPDTPSFFLRSLART